MEKKWRRTRKRRTYLEERRGGKSRTRRRKRKWRWLGGKIVEKEEREKKGTPDLLTRRRKWIRV